ncbi:hypothetical protein CYA_0669 [Synechococcus sp. JA-3-3Ab]|nr:hypothetical protein CYA_0669 [Synechococcus sp. JA-3-3Ab]
MRSFVKPGIPGAFCSRMREVYLSLQLPQPLAELI